MPGKSFFIDTTRCTACRGCQAACKQWNQNPGTKTTQQGTYQNPPDLSAATFKVVRYSEQSVPGKDPRWYFFPDQCRHCLYPLCKMAADRRAPGSVTLDSRMRATIFNPEVKMSAEAFREIREICPFDIPRYDENLGGMSKCTMCIDRIREGMPPACVKACPTGAMNFGEREDILKMARNQLDEVQQVHRNASLVHPESVRVIFLLKDTPEKYHEFAAARQSDHARMLASRRSFLGLAAFPVLS
jgi:formate dehydrogenase iron-sulfur subunit